MPGQPSQSGQKRNILVAVSGQTPAIVTETLWALENQRGIRIDQIRVITTSRGRDSIVSSLLGEAGSFTRYCADYGVPPGRIAFSEKDIYVLRASDGSELEDIRNSEDNAEAADQVFSLVREWAGRDDEVLFCSAAGGRKTLGIYLAMSLMLCGRPDDSISHVLVSPQFETGVRDFFYPPPKPRAFNRRTGFGPDGNPCLEPISSEEARLELADIPFPRLREAIGGDLPIEKGLTEAISRSQLILTYLQSPPPLILHLDTLLWKLGDISLHLPRQLLAVYAFFLLKSNGPTSHAGMDALFEERAIIAEFERAIDRCRQGEHESYSWRKMKDIEDFRSKISPCISKINRTIESGLGKNRLSFRYCIRTGKSYWVDVPEYEILPGTGHGG